MSKIYRCDRCGMIFDSPNMDGLKIYRYIDDRPLDLCDSCNQKIIDMLENKSDSYYGEASCEECKYVTKLQCEEPCKHCRHNYVNKFEKG